MLYYYTEELMLMKQTVVFMRGTKKDMKKKREKIELRFYEIPPKPPLVALLGDRWILNYGDDGPHFHNSLEIGYCYYGEGDMFLGKQVEKYSGRTFTLIPQNSIHRTQSEGESISRWEYLFIDIYRFLNECYPENLPYAKMLADKISSHPFVFKGQEHPRLETLLLIILDEMRDKKENYKETIRGYLFALMHEIARIIPTKEKKLLPFADHTVQHSLSEAINYMENHYQEDIKAGDLARINMMSESHFRRIFIESLNITPLEYLNAVRVQKACQLLAGTEESLDWIGNQVGFAIGPTFCRNFKKLIGVSPRQWRTQARQNEDMISNYHIAVYKGW